MIIVKLMGGLGNQMFQYALGRRLADKHNCELKLDVSFFSADPLRKYELSALNIKESFATEPEVERFCKNGKSAGLWGRLRRKKALPNSYIIEKHFHFDPSILDLPDNVYLEGYWQSEAYFKNIKNKILDEFEIKLPLEGANRSLYEDISSRNSVAIHVRRGDYVSDLKTNSIHGACSVEYYRDAVAYVRKKVEHPVFFVFSDEIDSVKAEFGTGDDFVFVNHNDSENGIQDLRLMSLCRRQIIANSTFSWWGAWLNRNLDKIVVAPRQWFRRPDMDTSDLYPAGWIKI